MRKFDFSNPSIVIKEIILCILVGILGALIIYTHQSNHTSLGLLTQPQPGSVLPVIPSFHSEILTEQQLLELHQTQWNAHYQQVEGMVVDPTHPPAVQELTALNTRVGNEIALHWIRPDAADFVNIYRTAVIDGVEDGNGNDVNTEKELIVELSTKDSFIDTDVKDHISYQYTAVSVNTVEDKEYYGKDSPVALATASDEIPPHAPTHTVVESSEEADTFGLHITWKNPADSDLDHLVLYRSTEPKTRGEELTTIQATSTPEYLDTDIEPNTRYYYTVIAYDGAENSSSDDFAVPTPGNEQPFERFVSEDDTIQEEIE